MFTAGYEPNNSCSFLVHQQLTSDKFQGSDSHQIKHVYSSLHTEHCQYDGINRSPLDYMRQGYQSPVWYR